MVTNANIQAMREGRYFSEEFGLWYDVYPCEAHGFHVDVDHDKEW